MTDQVLRRLLRWGAPAVFLAGAGVWPVSPAVALGVVAGGTWNLANLWCLARALGCWLVPGPRRTRLLWFVLKFPLLYAAALLALTRPGASFGGFILGFSIVLLAALAAALSLAQGARSTAHGG